MKRVIFILGVFLSLCFICTPSTWGVDFFYHTMTLEDRPDDDCPYLTPNSIFYDYHKAAYCFFLWTDANPESIILTEWYKPDGSLYRDISTPAIYVNGCWSPFISISGYTPVSYPGTWRVDVSCDNIYYFSEYFTLITLATSSTSTPTTAPETVCSISLIYGEQSSEVELLRYIRDNLLNKSQEGQELIKLYYQWSPAIVSAMEADEDFKEEVKTLVDGILPMLDTEATQ